MKIEELAKTKEGHWRSMWDSPKDGELVRLIGYLWESKTISITTGRYIVNPVAASWLTEDNVIFKPIGWMSLNEIPADETYFQVGKTYLSKEGFKVKIIKESNSFGHPYACVQGDDGGWRYNRPGGTEMGRVTASPGDLSHIGCLLLPSVEPDPGLLKSFINWLFK